MLSLHDARPILGPAGIELAAGRGAADVVAALQRQGLEAASRQVAGSGEAVVAGTHDNNVIARHASASPVLSRAWTELRQGPAAGLYFFERLNKIDRKSTRLNSSH